MVDRQDPNAVWFDATRFKLRWRVANSLNLRWGWIRDGVDSALQKIVDRVPRDWERGSSDRMS